MDLDQETQKIREKVSLDIFSDPLLEKLAGFFFSHYEKIDFGSVLGNFESKEEREIVAGLLLELTPPEEIDRTISECINSLKAGPIREKIENARMRLREKEKTKEDVSDILLEITELRNELKSLTMGNV